MKVMLIGHSVEDHIHINGAERVSPGGIYYSTLGLNSFMDESDELLLLTLIDKQSEQLFAPLYGKIRGDLIGYAAAIPKVHLTVLEHSERCEKYENLTQNLELPPAEYFRDADGILINMITGFDLRLEDLLKLRSSYKGLIFIDIHTLTRGLDEQNRRHFRLIPDADKWLSSVDIVQVNDNEIFALSGLKTEEEIIGHVLSLGVKILIVTRGSRGYSAYWKEEPEIKQLSGGAIEIKCVNRIGCGDIFGSVFFYYYLKTKDLEYSASIANTAAGCSTGYQSLNEFAKLKNDTFTRPD